MTEGRGKGKRVVVAMSGGVDSSVALARLVGEGYECVGVAMQLWDYSRSADDTGATAGSCCSLDDIGDARRVADSLGAPFYVVNVEEAFGREVVDYFVRGYLAGETPNPCVKCNDVLKFEVLLRKALALEADFLATGHYARVVRDGEAVRLLKGVDPAKDQSYFLFTMTSAQLGRTLFPVGGMTKGEVRDFARRLGLVNSEKEESQEICFVEGPGYAEFLTSRGAAAPASGEITDPAGRVLGTHAGTFNYTIGQRRGLGLSGGPFYVVDIDPAQNRVVVGAEGDLFSAGLVAREVNWIDPRAREAAAGGGLTGVTVKIRYRHAGAGAAITPAEGGRFEVRFREDQKAVAPGQAVVFYRGPEVLGGGWIERAVK